MLMQVHQAFDAVDIVKSINKLVSKLTNITKRMCTQYRMISTKL